MRHLGSIRTVWARGPMSEAEADQITRAIADQIVPQCGTDTAGARRSGDRQEGPFVTRHYGTLTVGIRGCETYRAEVARRFPDLI